MRHLLLEFADGNGGTDAGNDVFALGVHEELAVEFLFAVGGIAGEADAGAAGLVEIAVDHGLDVDGGSEPVVDMVEAR